MLIVKAKVSLTTSSHGAVFEKCVQVKKKKSLQTDQNSAFVECYHAYTVVKPLNTKTYGQQLIFTVVSAIFDTIAVVLLLVIVHELLNGHSTRNRSLTFA